MQELRRQFAGGLIVILTIAAVIAAGINFQQQGRFHLPEDGVTWVDRDRTCHFSRSRLVRVASSP